MSRPPPLPPVQIPPADCIAVPGLGCGHVSPLAKAFVGATCASSGRRHCCSALEIQHLSRHSVHPAAACPRAAATAACKRRAAAATRARDCHAAIFSRCISPSNGRYLIFFSTFETSFVLFQTRPIRVNELRATWLYSTFQNFTSLTTVWENSERHF